MVKLKLTTIGNSVGIVLPKEVLAQLDVDKGDSLVLTRTRDGFLLSVSDPVFDKEIKAAADNIKRYRNALKELAK